MPGRTAHRALAAATVLSLVVAGVATADSVLADADAVTSGTQGLINLGTVPAGATRTVDVSFGLACLGTSHATPGSTISLVPTTTPAAGGSMSATSATVGPVPADWPAAGEACPSDIVLTTGTPSTVTVTAPLVGGNYVYTVTYARTPSTGTSGTTRAQVAITVPANTPPSLDHPGDMTVEGDTTGGWVATFDVSASDLEDAVAPAVTCSVPPGDLLPLGTTTVSCTTTDTGGLTATGSFDVTVVDTTAPSFGALPAPVVTTTDAAGTSVSYATPSAVDVVDPAPSVSCSPASGSVFAVGASTVTCTTVDGSGNSSQATFPVVVDLQPATVVGGSFAEPLGSGWLTGRLGRTVPVKLSLTVDGVALAWSARPELRADRLAACSSDAAVLGSVALGALAWTDGRWVRNVDTSTLGAGCWRLVASVDGVDGPSAGLSLTPDNAVGAAGRPSRGGSAR